MTKEYIKKNQGCSCIYIGRSSKNLGYGTTGTVSLDRKDIIFAPDGKNRGDYLTRLEDLYKIGVSDPL